jgi:hypothetical protein
MLLRTSAQKEVIGIKRTSAFLICLLVFAAICGLGATLLWYFEEAENLEYYGKTLLDDRFPHSINPTFVDDRFPHSINPTFV